MGAWFLDQCRSNKGATGVDGQDFADIETYGVERWLGELALALRSHWALVCDMMIAFVGEQNFIGRPAGDAGYARHDAGRALHIEPIRQRTFDDAP